MSSAVWYTGPGPSLLRRPATQQLGFVLSREWGVGQGVGSGKMDSVSWEWRKRSACMGSVFFVRVVEFE